MRYLRWVAQAVAVAYLALALIVFGISAGEGDGDVASTLLVLAVPLVAGSIYCWGLVRPAGPRGRAIRAFGWFGMLVGSIALISFSFVVWPLLLLALPYSFLPTTGPMDTANGRMGQSRSVGVLTEESCGSLVELNSILESSAST
jgi:hypothetical protein